MSSISQNILMAFTATVNKYASSNARSVPRSHDRHRSATATATATPTAAEVGRRCLLLVATVVAAPQPSTDLLKRYLKKSEDNKAKNDKERLDSYYKRNYKDYFDFVEGSLQGKTEEQLTESEKGILDWLRKNK